MTFEDQVLAAIEEYHMLPPGARVVVGISGGADSVCLLTVLETLRRRGCLPGVRLRAVHVHHGLRVSADADEQYVRELCARLEIPLSVRHADAAAAANERGMGVEEAGRMLRREAFCGECAAWDKEADTSGERYASSGSSAECAPEAGEPMPAASGKGNSASGSSSQGICRVALAHHMEDSAETLLFHLCRGSSAAGLAGIRPVSALEDSFGEDASPVPVIRPLIRSSRAEIEAWLTRNGWSWCTDETNADTGYTRNYLRREIFPELEAHVNAGAARHMAKAALEWSEAEEVLREETRRRLDGCRMMTEGVNDVYSVSELAGSTLFWRRRMLYEALVQAADGGGESPARDVTSAHVGALLGLLETQGPARIDLPHGLRARKEYGRLIFERKDRAEGTPPEEDGEYALSPERYRTRTFPYHAQMRAQIPAGPCTKWIDYDKITQSLTFRTRQEGDVLALGPDEEGDMQCRKLTRVMIDRKVPERLRGRLVLPMDGTHVIWFPGYRIGADYRITEETRTVLEIRLTAPDQWRKD